MKRVLIAEDESAIREIIGITLRRAGYEVTETCDGQQALDTYAERNGEFDVVLLDIMMPNVDGLEVCKRLRGVSSTVGIIMLTAKTQEMDKVSGLLMGADDYITKPFSPSELMARVDSVYRRVAMNTQPPAQPVRADKITLEPFELNLRNRTLYKDTVQIELTQVEFQIVEYFFSNPGKALSRNDILKEVWGESYFGDEKVVDVNIRRLRMKIEDQPSIPKHLVTVWGMGYKWI
ncbi:MAG: response regulator transcription factor [Clostridia bacterium]|nr:response regulator transcription factor [Clostridia bacterium]